MPEFLSQLFSGVEEGFLTLTQLHDGGAPTIARFPIDDLSGVDPWVESHRSTVYYNVGVTRTDPKGSVRGSKSDVSNVCCLWLDIDMPKSDSKKMYPSMEHITAALADMPLRYTALVHTGGGLHVYWFLKEPASFETVEQAVAFEQSHTKPWLILFKNKLAKYGEYAIDSVYDVSRMMRIPNSWHKNGKQCLVVDSDYERRYYLDDFTPFLDHVNVEKLLPKFLPEFTKESDGKLSMERLDALLENSPAFKKVWTRKNTLGDDDSKVDASIIRHAVDAGWGDDEIADLVFAFNKKYTPHRVAKLFRNEPEYGNYIGRVISFARSQAFKANSLRSFESDQPPQLHDDPAHLDPTKPVNPADENEARLIALKKLSSILEMPVSGWIQIGREQPLYILTMADGLSMRIGGASAVVDGPEAFIRVLYSNYPKIGKKSITKAMWTNMLKGFGEIVEVVDAPEVQLSAMALTGIRQYVETTRVSSSEGERDNCFRHGKAFHDGRFLYVNMPDLMRWLNMHAGGHKWTNTEMISAFSAIGFSRESVHYERDGKRSTKSYWKCDSDQFKDLL